MCVGAGISSFNGTYELSEIDNIYYQTPGGYYDLRYSVDRWYFDGSYSGDDVYKCTTPISASPVGLTFTNTDPDMQPPPVVSSGGCLS